MNVAEAVVQELGTALQQVESGLRDAVSDASVPSRQVVLHLLESGGKRVRPTMALLSARVFTTDLTPVIPAAVAAELIHMATLVHDDVIDHASMRRGRHTVNYLWGNQTSVLTGDALLAKALVILVEQTTPAVVRLMANMIWQMCEGEIAQNASLYRQDQSEADYFDRIEKKTALFFAACCEAGALLAGASAEHVQALSAYGRHVGMAFQVADDLLDVRAEAEVVGKPVGNDLAAGVLTLPVLFMLGKPEYSERVRGLFDRGALGAGEISKVLALTRQSGAIDYAEAVAAGFVREAKAQLAQLPAGPGRDLLAGVADLAVGRTH